MKDDSGQMTVIPGSLKAVKAIGWLYRRIWDRTDKHQSYQYKYYTSAYCF
jgi:hypothetical protein